MKCYIIGAMDIKNIKINKKEKDLVIAADGGYIQAIKKNIKIDLLVGDFDSLKEIPNNIEIKKLNKEKDETDTFIAIEEAIKRGYTEIILLGCLGGRIEHTIANIQILAHYINQNILINMLDKKQKIYMLKENMTKIIDKKLQYLSVFSYTNESIVSLKGFKYNLDNYLLTNYFPLGIDNETKEDKGMIIVHKGMILVIENE